MVQYSQTFGLVAPYYDEDYLQKQLRRLAVLPHALNQLGQALVGVQKRGEPYDYEKQQQRTSRAFEELAVLSQPDRQRLFAALAPSIANEIEAAWQVFDHLPYATGSNRRPFRLNAQENPVDANRARSTWVWRLLRAVQGFDQPVTWFATWAASLTWGTMDSLGILLAGAIDRGGSTGQEVFDILTASARGDHPTGKMGRHVVRGLLCASRPDGWDFIVRLLLAAQREEGLRQVIMEAADEAHPEAFKHILRVVIEQNLIRFSAVVRAATVWAGLPFEAANPKTVLEVLTKLQNLLEHADARHAMLTSGAPENQYLALWCIAYGDAIQAIEAARPLLEHPQPEYRFAAVYLLSQMQLAESERVLLLALDDSDLRVAAYAYAGIAARGMVGSWYVESDLFERMERLIQRLPERTKTLQPIVWDWMTLQIERKSLADALIKTLGTRPPARLLPYLKGMDASARLAAAKLFQEHIDEDPRNRKALFDLAADRDGYVHERVLSLLEKIQPRAEEIPQLEALLTRKTSGVRRGVMGLLLNQPDDGVLATIDRLLNQKDEQQHLAGVELLREMAQTGRKSGEYRALVTRLKTAALPEVEKHILDDLITEDSTYYSLEDALGLANPNNLSQPVEPHSKNALFGLVKKIRLGSAAAAACIRALDDLIDQHRTEPVQLNGWQNESRTELLGNVRWGLANPDPGLPAVENRQRFQLTEVWEQWWQERPKSQRDEDGLELLRAQAALTLLTGQNSGNGEWIQVVPKELRIYLDHPYDLHLKYQGVVQNVLDWLIFLHPAPGGVEFLLNAVEETCYRFGQHRVASGMDSAGNRRAIAANRLGYMNLVRRHRKLSPAKWTGSQHARFWGLMVWLERFTWRNGGIYRPMLEDLLLAYQTGKASEDDLFLYLLGERETAQPQQRLGSQLQFTASPQQFSDLRAYSGKHLQPILTEYPVLKQAVDRCRERILQVELRRGDLPTPASAPALALRSVPGMDILVRLVSALGKTELDRSLYAFDQNRSNVLSHLIRVSYPLETDTPQAFANRMRAAHIPERRLVELAVFAPQWATFIEYTLGWSGLSEGVWWVYAHTKDRQWSVETEIRDSWAAQIGEYTPLSADALVDGAVDVAWFHRMHAALGEARWQEIYRAALYAASGTGHARARLFADAMSGKLDAAGLIERIKDKRNQDAVRALGLIPLPEDEAQREISRSEILRRYEVMQEFLRTSKQFGSQRQASEKLAASIGMENLARTAGYMDPQRLEWAMEMEAAADLASGPVTVQADGVSVTLAISDLAEPELSIHRGEKILKNIPPALKKNEPVTALIERKEALEQQARRMRASLEAAMVRGDTFSASEIQTLFGHPILRVMLEQLVFTSPAGMGYPVEAGRALEGIGKYTPLDAGDRLRIAHPYDLLQSGCWHDWQHECFITERIQPFKQVFRELYVLTETEQDEKNFSRRYAGQQVNPRQALALFGARGWVTAPDEGVFKTFHAEGIVARVGFLQAFYTPAEVEGLTIEMVGFTRRGTWLPIQLEQVPPRLFSEVMRDLDLVVSVAHAGRVDPEASASTIESRAALVQETCTLLKFTNVRIENHHALVDGKLGNYTIHLGSGTVHKQPGGALCIIPVYSQHRGRLFLPFVDSDPKTAEIISKVLLLSKDQDIKDPTILEQILR